MGDRPITPRVLPPELNELLAATRNQGRTDPTERELRRLLQQHHANVTAVARALGRQRKQVYRWLERLGINPKDYR